MRYKVIDLFAGPGGLAEGFSSVLDKAGERVFEIVLSVEKDEAAHRTLTLRAFTRQFPPGALPDDYYAMHDGKITLDELAARWRLEWEAANREAQLVELGTSHGNRRVNRLIDDLLEGSGAAEFVVIGGPPCQAYSLVGRARNRGIEGYRADKDRRHYLYREYIKILQRVRPAVFVMENVKGMLSSSVGGREIFSRVRRDLEEAGGVPGSYELLALSPASEDLFAENGEFVDRDFVIRSERHGVPQARHRVIIVGVRRNLFDALPATATRMKLDEAQQPVTVRQAIGDLPPVRSALSRGDDAEAWTAAVNDEMDLVCSALRDHAASLPAVIDTAENARSLFARRNHIPDRQSDSPASPIGGNDDLADFIADPRLGSLRDHEARGHMKSDLGRYFFCASFAEALAESPKASDFPSRLAPDHANWKSGKFADRFRVQTWDRPSTTVVSHISKDGHYYIHPDPVQCRSLTPREAARLQTFPDNYIFLGNRTERFHQIGNAVPPYLAMQIGQVVSEFFEELNDK